MTTDKLIGRMRRLLGVRANEVPNREAMEFLISSLSWLAQELEFDIHTEALVGIEEDQIEVPLPASLMFMISVSLGDTPLEVISFTELDREGTWRTVDSGTPTRYAIHGRKLILNPPPDDTALEDDETLTWCWIGSGRDLTAAGPQGLSEVDQDLLCYDAALGWLASHPSPDNTTKSASFTAEVNRRLPAARKRWQQPVPTNSPQFVTDTMTRGAAR